MTDENEPKQPAPPEPCPEPVQGMRSFSLNSREFYEAVTEPRPSWCWGPGVPGHKGSWLPRAIPGVAWVSEEETDYPF